MAGEELPPVVATLVGDDESFLAMLERDIEAARAFAAQLQDALDEGIGGITVSGAQISGQGIGAAGEAIGEQLASGIEEGIGSLDLRAEMQGAAAGAAEAGQGAGDEFASGFAEAASGAGDTTGASIANSLRTEVSGGASSAGESVVSALADAGSRAGHEVASGLTQALGGAGVQGAAALAAAIETGAAPIGVVVAAQIGATLTGALPVAGRIAGSALGDALVEGVAVGDLVGAQFSEQLREQIAARAPETMALLGDAMTEGAAGIGDALGSQLGAELRGSVTTAGQQAGAALSDALLESTAAVGDILGEQLGAGVQESLSGALSGEAGIVAGMAAAAGDEMEQAGQESAARYVQGFTQGAGALTSQRDWRLGPMPLPSDMPEAADPFVQDPSAPSRVVLQSILAQEQAARDAVAQEARSVADAARAALIDAFGSSGWQISGEQFAQLTDAGVAEWRAEVDAQAAAAGSGFATEFADALRAQFATLDWSTLSDVQAAALEDALSATAQGAGRAAGAAAGAGVGTGIEAALASDEAFLQAAMDAGMSRPMMAAVQDLRAGIEADLSQLPNDLLGAFEGIQERFAQEGTAAGTAYALSLQEALNSQSAMLRPVTQTGAQPEYVDLSANLAQWQSLEGKVSGEAGAAAGEIGKVGTAAAGAGGAMGALGGVLNGPLMFGLMGVAGFLPMLSGLFQNTGVSAADFTQAVSQDANAVGDNTAATIQNVLAKSDLSSISAQLGLSQAQLIEYAAGEADVQKQVAAAYDAQQAALEKAAPATETYGRAVSAQQADARELSVTLSDQKDQLDRVTNAVAQAIEQNRQNSEALLAAEQTTQIYNASVGALVANLKLQAEQAHMNADAQAAYDMTLTVGSQQYTQAVDNQIVALNDNAIKAQINATALNQSLEPQSQLSQQAIIAADAYQQASTATGAYTNALTALYGQYGQTTGAEAAATTAVDNLSGHITSGKGAVDAMTAAGAKNLAQFQQAASAAETYSEKLYQQTGDAGKATQALQDFATKIDHAAAEANLSKKQIDDLNTALFGVPDVKDITIKADTTPAEQQMSALSGFIQGEIDSLNAKPINLFINSEITDINSAPPNLFGGGHPLRDGGGPVEAGHPYMIGLNRRPEVFVPGASGYITPMDMLTPAMASVAAGAAEGLGAGAGFGSVTVFAPIYLDGRLIGQAVTPGTRAGAQQFARHNAITGMAGNYS